MHRSNRHSITSSARASNVGDTPRPSARAVLRFTMNSNLAGCSTGSSEGFAPLRILVDVITRTTENSIIARPIGREGARIDSLPGIHRCRQTVIQGQIGRARRPIAQEHQRAQRLDSPRRAEAHDAISHPVYVMGHATIVFEGTPADLSANEAVRKQW